MPDDRSGLSEGTAKEKRSQGQLQAGSNVSGAQLRFAKQSNMRLRPALRNARRFPHPAHASGGKATRSFRRILPRESPELAQPISGVQRRRHRRRLDPGYPLTRIPGARKEKKKSPLAPLMGVEGDDVPKTEGLWLTEWERGWPQNKAPNSQKSPSLPFAQNQAANAPWALKTLSPLRGRGETILLRSCLLYTSPSPRDRQKSRMPSSA